MKSKPLSINTPEDIFKSLSVSVSDNTEEQELLIKAIKFALDNRVDKNKPPYSIEVVMILKNLGVDQATIIATILSDRDFLDCLPNSTLTEEYGKTISTIVISVRRLNNFRNCNKNEATKPSVPEQAERVRRMVMAMADDLRAVLIKFAWRLQHLRVLDQVSFNKRQCIAQETLDIFAPIANRLGVSQLKWEMEDLSFRYLHPLTYKRLAKSLSDKRVEREEYVEAFVQELNKVMDEFKIQAEVYGRPKHIYSIYKKMERKDLDTIDQLYDLRAIRIIVDDTGTCYKLLGEIQHRWQPIRDEYDDYIANRKPNGYQSLHTVVYGPNGKTVEIQIRTQDMHIAAEFGVAAHWQYKLNDGKSANQVKSIKDIVMEKAVNPLQEMLSQKPSDTVLLEDFKAEMYSDRVFVMTPKGDVMDLPKHSTPLDFAYAVHTSIGHRCYGAKVNGRIVPLSYQLKNEEQVEVLTKKEEKPKRRWLNSSQGYLRSSKARNAVRHWLRQQDHGTNKKDGVAVLEREAHRLAINIKSIDYKKLLSQLHVQNKDDLLIALGRGDISVQQITKALSPSTPSPSKKKHHTGGHNPHSLYGSSSKQALDSKEIHVEGVANLLTNIANCCQPVPGDDIIGYITLGKGVSVHRTSCPNILTDNLTDEQKSRITTVSWGDYANNYSVDIQVSGMDRPGFLRDTTFVIAKEGVNILDIRIDREEDSVRAVIRITVQVEDTKKLDLILSKLADLKSVIDVKRAGKMMPYK